MLHFVDINRLLCRVTCMLYVIVKSLGEGFVLKMCLGVGKEIGWPAHYLFSAYKFGKF